LTAELSNTDVIRDQYDAVNERDFDRAMSHYAEDVVLVVREGLPPGTYEGADAVGGWFGDWFATFDRDSHFDITRLEEPEEGSVLLVADYQGSGRGSGARIEGNVVWLYHLRDGNIVRVEGGTSLDLIEEMGFSD
jgi:ketosteroid isomerase-like protein